MLEGSPVPYVFAVKGLEASYFTVRSFEGRETLSEAYSFKVLASARAGATDQIEQIALGQSAVFTWDVGGEERAFYGIVAGVRVAGRRDGDRTAYRFQLVPRMWLLKRKRRTRIFQKMRVPDIVTSVLLEEGIAARWRLALDYPVREYCTQYEETDFEFLRRLLAEAGIYFRFVQGPSVDDAFATMSAVATAVGNVGDTMLDADIGPSVRGGLRSASPTLPGDTVLFSDDALFYAPIGADDPAILASATLIAAAPCAVETVAGMAGGAGVVAEVASSAAGTIVGAIPSTSPRSLHYIEMMASSMARADKITRFAVSSSVRATRAVYRDYNPERPLTKLESRALNVAPFPETTLKQVAEAATAAGAVGPGVARELGGAVASAAGRGAALVDGALGSSPPDLELYDHHSPYLFPKWPHSATEAPKMLRQARRRAVVARGGGGCSDLSAGKTFALAGHPILHWDQGYVVTRVEHRGHSHAEAATSDEDLVYENSFECVPSSVTYVPPKPKRTSVQVSLTATVVGPEGSEIHVDAFGRIKVQFHWDREGKLDEGSSCWIHTMHPWGGAGWGVQFIPRVGMEVVVAFEGGDPDKPLVLGAIYNATHPSPFSLPAQKTRSGWKTQSSPGGAGYNELSFEDAAGTEQIFVRAQRDLDEVVQRNHTLQVQNDELIRILGNRLDTVEKQLEEHVIGDHLSRVDGNRIDVVSGNVDRRVSGVLATRVEGQERRDVQGATNLVYADDVTTRVLGASTTIVGRNDARRSWTTHAEGTVSLSGADRVAISSAVELSFSVGPTAIRLSKDGIELCSSSISTKSDAGSLKVDGAGLSLTTKDSKMLIADRIVMQGTAGSMAIGKEVRIDGSRILLNAPDRATEPAPALPEPPTIVELTDQDGNPVPLQRFVVKLSAGAEVGGRTDNEGQAQLDIPSDGDIVFPDLGGQAPPEGDPEPYVIKQGDYVAKLAAMYGFDAAAVWSDASNKELRDKREDPNILAPGDVLRFARAEPPGRPIRKASVNRYSVTIPKTKVSVIFVEGDRGLANEAYLLEGLGKPLEGTTDAAGTVTFDAPVHVREVALTFKERGVTYPVRIGNMDPIEEPSGQRKRLQQLGYYDEFDGNAAGSADDASRLAEAIGAFQAAMGRPVTGIPDQATSDALRKEQGS